MNSKDHSSSKMALNLPSPWASSGIIGRPVKASPASRLPESINAAGDCKVAKTWSPRSTVIPATIGDTFAVHNGALVALAPSGQLYRGTAAAGFAPLKDVSGITSLFRFDDRLFAVAGNDPARIVEIADDGTGFRAVDRTPWRGRTPWTPGCP